MISSQRAADHRVDVPLAPEERDVGQDPRHHDRPERGQDGAGQQEEVLRAVDEQEAQVPPAVAPGRELRLARARVVLDRELPDVEVELRRADHHLRGELHAGCAEVEGGQDLAPQRAHAAVGVLDLGAEERG